MFARRHPRHNQFKKMKARRGQEPAPTPQAPGATAFVFADEYSIAGFVFEWRDSVLYPVSEVAPFSPVEKSLNSEIGRAANERSIAELIVPPNSESNRETNQLYKILPPGYRTRVASGKPTFAECCAVRSIGLNAGRFVENDYSKATKLIEQMGQCHEGRPPTPLLWAYLLGLHELLSVPDWSQIDPDKFFFSASPPLF